MAFGRSEYDELKELGMTPKEIRDAVAASKELKEKHTSLETEFNTTKTALSSLEGSFNETKNKLNELEANSRRQPEKTNNEERPLKTSFIDDEDKAFNERFNERVSPIAQTALNAARNSAKMAAKMSLHGQFITTPGGRISLTRLWDKWEGEIETDSKQVNLAALGDMTTWINMFNYVKGKHINEMMAEPQTFVESVQSSTDTRVREDRSQDNGKLNDEENATIKKMSKYSKFVTDKSYQETKNKMKFVGDNA
jgi:hypothetical protein